MRGISFFVHLDATRVAATMERRVMCSAGEMVVNGHRYALSGYRNLLLISIGKAAGTMAAAFLRVVGDESARMRGVIAGVCEQQLPKQLQVFAGGHPRPNQASLDAAAFLLRLLKSAGDGDLVVFLVSGGGSSMVEQMLRDDISLEDLASTHKALVESGAPIAAINVVRKHLSAVKGGRLAAAAAPAQQLTIFVSDVPVGELDALASGPTLPDRSTVTTYNALPPNINLYPCCLRPWQICSRRRWLRRRSRAMRSLRSRSGRPCWTAHRLKEQLQHERQRSVGM